MKAKKVTIQVSVPEHIVQEWRDCADTEGWRVQNLIIVATNQHVRRLRRDKQPGILPPNVIKFSRVEVSSK